MDAARAGSLGCEGSRDRAREKATRAIESHCPTEYRILVEGEELVPPEHYDNWDPENRVSVGESSESLRSGYKNEYRITYVCTTTAVPETVPAVSR